MYLFVYLWLLLLFSWWDGTVALRDCSSNEPTVILSDFRQICSICGMILTDINRSTWTKTCPVCPVYRLRLLRDRTRPFAAKDRRLIISRWNVRCRRYVRTRAVLCICPAPQGCRRSCLMCRVTDSSLLCVKDGNDIGRC